LIIYKRFETSTPMNLTQIRSNKFRFFVILLLMLEFLPLAKAWTITLNAQKEIWITPGTAGGTGTYADPFKVSSSSDLDTLMVAAIAANVKIFRLTPGTFYTTGYFPSNPTGLGSKWSLPEGSKLIGSGMDPSWAGTSGTLLKRDNAILSQANGTFASIMTAIR